MFRKPVLHWALLGAVLMLCWNTPVGYPIKISAVFCHEVSHALTAWALDVPVLGIGINADCTGVTTYLRPQGDSVAVKSFIS